MTSAIWCKIENIINKNLFLQDEDLLRLEAQRGALQLQGLQSHEVPWTQERTMLQQEVRLFRRNTVIIYMKLRWILMHWRLARKGDGGEEAVLPEVGFQAQSILQTCWFGHFFDTDIFQFDKLESLPDVGVVMGQAEGESDQEDRLCLPPTPGDLPDPGAISPHDQHLQHQRQVHRQF